jgi:hypothetical protein
MITLMRKVRAMTSQEMTTVRVLTCLAIFFLCEPIDSDVFREDLNWYDDHDWR